MDSKFAEDPSGSISLHWRRLCGSCDAPTDVYVVVVSSCRYCQGWQSFCCCWSSRGRGRQCCNIGQPCETFMMNEEAVDDAEGKFARPASVYIVIFLADATVHLSSRCINAEGFLPDVLIVAGCMLQTFWRMLNHGKCTRKRGSVQQWLCQQILSEIQTEFYVSRSMVKEHVRMLHWFHNICTCDHQPKNVHDQLLPNLPRAPTEWVVTLHLVVGIRSAHVFIVHQHASGLHLARTIGRTSRTHCLNWRAHGAQYEVIISIFPPHSHNSCIRCLLCQALANFQRHPYLQVSRKLFPIGETGASHIKPPLIFQKFEQIRRRVNSVDVDGIAFSLTITEADLKGQDYFANYSADYVMVLALSRFW